MSKTISKVNNESTFWFIILCSVCLVIFLICFVPMRNNAGAECYQMRKMYPSMNFRVRVAICQVETDDGWFAVWRILGKILEE